MTTLRLAAGPADDMTTDTLVVAVATGASDTTNSPKHCHPAIDAELIGSRATGSLQQAIAGVCIAGPLDATIAIPAPAAFTANTLLLTPIHGEATPEALRRAIGAGLRAVKGGGSVAVCTNDDDPGAFRAVCEGAALGAYRFDRFRHDSKTPRQQAPKSVAGLLSSPATKEQTAVAKQAFALADAVCEARDLVNMPPNALYPAALARRAKTYLAESPVAVEVTKPKELAKGGYGGLVGVGQGSKHGPRLVKLDYDPEGATGHVALVGKGITFDSGGLSIKPAKSMEWMKSDMGGAAAVLAAVRAVADQALPIRVTGWLAIAENMPSGAAQRPGDVITIRGGKTVEVLNTDAEGRLVLADGIVRAAEDEPDTIIDVATLTGAQMVALGPLVCGVMANDEQLRTDIVAAADAAGESAWPMPLPPELRKSLNSPIADLANIGDRNGGMLTAGLFLAEFVPDEIEWAHLDIAGPSWNPAEPHGYTPKGGTGFAVRTLVEYLTRRSR